MQTITLQNGVTLHFIPAPKFKTTNLTISIARPLCAQEATKNSLIPSVLRRGCRKFPTTRALNLYLDELYGASFSYSVKKQGSFQVMNLHFKTVSDRYGEDSPFLRLTQLAIDVLFDPLAAGGSFSEEIVRREKETLKEFIESIANEKRQYASLRLFEEMFRDDPYSIFEYGRIADLDHITPENLYAHYQQLLQHSAFDIFITGSADEDRITKLFRRAFQNRRVSPLRPLPTGIKKTTEVHTVEEEQPVTQGKLAMGYTVPILRTDPGYYAMLVFNNLFGGAPHSKLFLNVREKLSLAYYASSSYDSFKGVLSVHCGIEFSNYDVTCREIAAQLRAMQEGSFTEEEVRFSILALENMYESVKDSGDALEALYAGQMLLGICEDVDSIIQNIRKVTKDQVVAAAKQVVLDTVYFLKGE